MEKDTHLMNIYLKIYNKKTLTIDDLRYLAKYDVECFEKTCKNVVYNMPEVKPVMEVTALQLVEPETAKMQPVKDVPEGSPDISQENYIEQILANLKELEIKVGSFENVDAERVRNLLGNLYMELMFPHNDKDTFMDMPNNRGNSLFDKKA